MKKALSVRTAFWLAAALLGAQEKAFNQEEAFNIDDEMRQAVWEDFLNVKMASDKDIGLLVPVSADLDRFFSALSRRRILQESFTNDSADILVFYFKRHLNRFVFNQWITGEARYEDGLRRIKVKLSGRQILLGEVLVDSQNKIVAADFQFK